MIQDLFMEQNNQGEWDLVVDPETNDFKTVEGFETTINVQLYLDQRVSKEDRSNAQDRRGFIGDIIDRGDGYQIGSLLHLKEQSKDTAVNNNEIASHAKNALNYLVSIGAAKDVEAKVVGKNIEGVITSNANQVNRYSQLWRDTDPNG